MKPHVLVLVLVGLAAAAAPSLALQPPPPLPPPPPHERGDAPPPPPHPGEFGEHGRHGGKGKDWGRPLTPEEVDLALRTMREIDPAHADEFDRMREQDPERVPRELRERFPRIREFLALHRYDRPMFDLRVQDLKLARESRDLSKRINDARDADADGRADAMEDELATLVERHFDVRQQIRQRELERLEARIAELREQLDERADDKSDLIEAHVERLLSGERGEW